MIRSSKITAYMENSGKLDGTSFIQSNSWLKLQAENICPIMKVGLSVWIFLHYYINSDDQIHSR